MLKKDVELYNLEMERENIMTAHTMGLLQSDEAYRLYSEVKKKIYNIIIANEKN